jgi:F0F1-type ATP synthase membrane subunit b/b'
MISTLMTSAKLKILQSRDNHIKSIMADVNKKMTKIRGNKAQYKQILKNLILQGLYQVLLI